MTERRNLLDLATNYHRGLPHRIRRYLNARGITDVLIDFHLLGWNGGRITIPVLDREGQLVFFKLAKDPEDKSDAPKMLAWPAHPVELYGWDHVLAGPRQLILCEGEFDRLVLEAQGFYAVTSTGGAGVFRPEWAEALDPIPEVYVCFDRDEAGQRGALRVGRMIPEAKLVALPEEVGEGGDVTDFFVRLGRTREDFLALMERVQPAPPAPEPAVPVRRAQSTETASALRQRIDRLKSAVPIVEVVRQYVELRPSGSAFVGLCPFHDDHVPSFTVYPATGTFYCYGCRRHGDVIGFLQEIEHLSFGQALEALEALWYPHGARSSHQ